MDTQICRTCGATFGTGDNRFRYCEEHRLERAELRAKIAREYRARTRLRRPPAQCRTCGKDFRRQGPTQYCPEHRLNTAARKARDQRNRRARMRAERKPLRCQGCGAEFLAQRADAKWCAVCRVAEYKHAQDRSEERRRHACPDCGGQISRTSIRCRPCSTKIGSQKRSRENSVHWKGGRSRSSRGYVYLLVAPEARKGHRYRAEHIVVWEKANGKSLPKGWVIHHLNTVKDDNRIENLLAVPRREHNHVERRIKELEQQIRALGGTVK